VRGLKIKVRNQIYELKIKKSSSYYFINSVMEITKIIKSHKGVQKYATIYY